MRGSPAVVVTADGPDDSPAPPARWRLTLLWLFLLGPIAGLALAIVLAAAVHIGPSVFDLCLAASLFVVTGHGVTVGLHRYFTHGSFRANRTLKIALAVAGCLSLEGDVTGWVATHRLHHARSDRDGDPHSPWRYGTGPVALARGLVWAQVGWFFSTQTISKQHYAPDLVADPDLRRIDRVYPLWVALTVLGPAVAGAAVSRTWTGVLTAFLWAGLARILLLHHVTWMVNSLCHVVGARPFRSRDRAANVWPLAVISLGDSWHNLHHADPTCARHGVDRGQLDSSAALIRIFERCGWATKVRWPDPERLQARRITSTGPEAPAAPRPRVHARS